MKIDHAEALQRGKNYWVRNGHSYAGMKVAEQVATLIEQAVRETAEECARIARHGEMSGQRLTGIGVESDIRAAFGIPRASPAPDSNRALAVDGLAGAVSQERQGVDDGAISPNLQEDF